MFLSPSIASSSNFHLCPFFHAFACVDRSRVKVYMYIVCAHTYLYETWSAIPFWRKPPWPKAQVSSEKDCSDSDFHGVHIHGQIFLVIAFDSVQCPLLSIEVCFPEDEINEEAGGRRANVLL